MLDAESGNIPRARPIGTLGRKSTEHTVDRTLDPWNHPCLAAVTGQLW